MRILCSYMHFLNCWHKTEVPVDILHKNVHSWYFCSKRLAWKCVSNRENAFLAKCCGASVWCMRPANKTNAPLSPPNHAWLVRFDSYTLCTVTGNLLARSPAASSPLASHSHTRVSILEQIQPTNVRLIIYSRWALEAHIAHIPTFVTHSWCLSSVVRVSKLLSTSRETASARE
jgi:hypothetical protein